MGELIFGRRRVRGMTLLEVVIAGALAAILLGGLLSATQRGQDAYRRSSANTGLDAKAGRVMDRLLRDLSAASFARLDPSDPVAPFGSERLQFDRPVSFTAGVPDWGERVELRWEREPNEIDNGLDDDGDGLIDEGLAVLVRDPGGPDEQRVVLARSVAEFLEGETANALDDNGNGLEDEPGLCFERRDDGLVVRLSVQALGPDRELMVRTVESTVTPRN